MEYGNSLAFDAGFQFVDASHKKIWVGSDDAFELFLNMWMEYGNSLAAWPGSMRCVLRLGFRSLISALSRVALILPARAEYGNSLAGLYEMCAKKFANTWVSIFDFSSFARGFDSSCAAAAACTIARCKKIHGRKRGIDSGNVW